MSKKADNLAKDKSPNVKLNLTILFMIIVISIAGLIFAVTYNGNIHLSHAHKQNTSVEQ